MPSAQSAGESLPLRARPTANPSTDPSPWSWMIAVCSTKYATAAASSTMPHTATGTGKTNHAAAGGGDGGEVVPPEPLGGERDQREPEQQVQVGPQDPARHPGRDLEHVVVVVPVDAQVDEAQHVCEQHGQVVVQR